MSVGKILGGKYVPMSSGSGNGGSEGSALITYEKEITTTQYNWWYVEDKDGQPLNANEYDLISVIFIRRDSDGESSLSYLFCPYQIDTVTSPADYPTYAMTLVGMNDGNFYRSTLTKKIRVNYAPKGSLIVSQSGGATLPDYSLTEVATGEKWIDGKAVYRRVYDMNQMSAPASNQWADLNIDTSGMSTLIDAVFLGDDAQGRFDNTVFSGWGATNNNVTNTLWILPTVMTGVLSYVILTYTKTDE